MYSNRSSSNNSPHRYKESVVLPKLPPLNTRSSFLDQVRNSNSHKSTHSKNDSIQCTQQGQYYNDINHLRHQSNNTPGGNTNHDSNILSPALPIQQYPRHVDNLNKNTSSLLNAHINTTPPRHRRPPPPSMGFVSNKNTSPSFSNNNSNNIDNIDNFVNPVTPVQEFNNFYNQTPTSAEKVYNSPFVGELELQWSIDNNINNTSLPNNSTSPAQNQYGNKSIQAYNSPFVDTAGINSINRSQEQDNNEYEYDDFYRRPPPVISNMRNISGLSKFSDSLDSYYSDSNYTFNNSTARHSSFNSLLGGRPLEIAPSVTAPTQPFVIDNLDENKLYQCYSIYKLSDIYEWLLKVYFEWFNEFLFGKFEFYQLVQRLLEFQMPNNFDQDTIDSNVDKIINSLVLQNAVRFEKNNSTEISNDITIIIAGLDIQGIFTELLPCYSFEEIATNDDSLLRCYSTICLTRLPNKNKREDIPISDMINKSVGVWAEYWHLTREELDEINPREVQRQSFIFDLIILEERSLNMANAAVEVYGKKFTPDLLPDDPDFASMAFDIFKPMIQLHKEYLLNPIFWKIKTRGKFIDGIGKIYLKWCNEAKDIYINYAKSMATVHEIISWAKKHKTRFANWLRHIDNSPEITRSKLYHDVIFFGGFFKSLQNLPVTLNSILKNTDPSLEDYDYLKLVISDVEKLSAMVDKIHGTAIDHRNLVRFSKQLVFNSHNTMNTVAYVNISSSAIDDSNVASEFSSQDKLELGLTNDGRKLILSGSLLKKRDLWLDPSPVFIALLDNYLLITEIVIKNGQKFYKLTERPIPLEYLSLEKKKLYDQPSNNSMRDLVQGESGRPSSQLLHTPVSAVRPHLLSAAVTRTIYPSERDLKNHTEISNNSPNEQEVSFKIRNTATNDSFTFIASNVSEKERWEDAIINSFKVNKKNKTPSVIGLDILSTQFAYSDRDAPVNLPVALDGSEIDIALKNYDKRKKEEVGFPMVTTIFTSLMIHYEDKHFLLVACNYGVFIRMEDGADRKFLKIIQCSSVNMMEVNHKLGLLFVLDNKSLIYFSIPSVLGAYYDHDKYLIDNVLVGIVIREKVSCFKFAEDFGNSRHLLYERKGKISVLTPEFDQLTKTIKYFKEYKEYKLPSPTVSLGNLVVTRIIPFKKCFLLCTSKGVLLFMDEFNDDGLALPTFLNDKTMYDYSSSSHLGKKLFKSSVDPTLQPGSSSSLTSSSTKDSSKQKMTEFVRKDIVDNKTEPLTCFQMNDSKNFLIVYDEAVVKINQNGGITNWKTDILVLDFYCTNAIMFKGYLILTAESLIQIYDLEKDSDRELCNVVPIQIIKGKKVSLLNTNNDIEDIMLMLSHPNIPNRQVLLKCTTKS